MEAAEGPITPIDFENLLIYHYVVYNLHDCHLATVDLHCPLSYM